MKMTLQLKASILSLLEEFIRQSGANGIKMSESLVSKLATNSRDTAGNLRRWDGGPRGPTMETCGKLEAWLADQLGEKAYKAFVQREARKQLPDGGF